SSRGSAESRPPRNRFPTARVPQPGEPCAAASRAATTQEGEMPRQMEARWFRVSAIVVLGLSACAEDGPARAAHRLNRAVDKPKELTITDPSVVEAAGATYDGCAAVSSLGQWTFGALMSGLAERAGTDPAQFVEDWLLTWAFNQNINNLSVAARPD